MTLSHNTLRLPLYPQVRGGMRRTVKGAAIVEFALVLPLFLLVLVGIIELSIALYNQSVLVGAARSASRSLALVIPKDSTAVQTAAVTQAQSNLITFGGSATPTYAALNNFYDTNSVTVRLTYTYTGLGVTTSVSRLARLVGVTTVPSSILIKGEATMVKEAAF